MPAFARATASLPPAPARRGKSHDCHCGGTCGSCAKRDQRESPCSGGGCGHDFARVAVGPPASDHRDVDGQAVCNKQTGDVDVKVFRETCAGKFSTKHEEVHKEHRTPCCERYSRGWKAATTPAAKKACDDAYDAWMLQSKDWSECRVLAIEIPLIEDFIALNCRNESDAPAIGAAIGAGAGALGGGIGGAFAGQAIAEGTSMSATAAGALGSVVGAIGGGLLGALIGFGIGHIVKAAMQEDVSSSCCDQLKDVELWGAKQQFDKDCAAMGGPEVPCPFDAEGKIIAPAAPAPTATFNAPSAGPGAEA